MKYNNQFRNRKDEKMTTENPILSSDQPADYDLNESGIPKEHIKSLIRLYGMKPGMNTALFIASGSLGRKTTWTGTDYAEHYLRVSGIGLGQRYGISHEEIIVGILHDVVEDSDWTIEDLREIGFDNKICNAVRSVTKDKDIKEKYLDASKRASIDPIGRRVKMRDNYDNMDLTRGPFAAGNKQKYLYHISYTYLDAVDRGMITPNSSIWDFLQDERFSTLINDENAAIIAANVSEPPPQYFSRKFNMLATGAAAHPAPGPL